MRRVLPVLAVALVLGACSGGDDGGAADTTLAALATDTSESRDPTTPTTEAADLTATTSTTSTTASTTSAEGTTGPTTTAPAGAALVIDANRLGQASFGTGADSAVSYVSSVLGAPADDTDWQDVRAVGRPCPGTEARFVTWGDGLTLFFTDESPAATSFRHFAGYTYEASETMSPAGLALGTGVTLGSALRDLERGYPGTAVYVDDAFGATAETPEGIVVHLTGTSGSDTVVSFVVGAGCGE